MPKKLRCAFAGEAGSRIAFRYLTFAHGRPLHISFHQRRIDHRAGLDEEAALLELGVQGLEDRLRQARLG